jgi:NAD-dependent deacetylase
MHGEMRKLRCAACGDVRAHAEDITTAMACAACARTGRLRPDIVWFGEMPYHMDHIARALDQADIFCAIGTSGLVYPAAGFAEIARHNRRGCRTVEINPVPTGGLFTNVIAANAVAGVTRWIESLTTNQT